MRDDEFGQGIAIVFTKAGVTGYLLGLKQEKLQNTVKQCEQLGARFLPLERNVADPAARVVPHLGRADVRKMTVGQISCSFEPCWNEP